MEIRLPPPPPPFFFSSFFFHSEPLFFSPPPPFPFVVLISSKRLHIWYTRKLEGLAIIRSAFSLLFPLLLSFFLFFFLFFFFPPVQRPPFFPSSFTRDASVQLVPSHARRPFISARSLFPFFRDTPSLAPFSFPRSSLPLLNRNDHSMNATSEATHPGKEVPLRESIGVFSFFFSSFSLLSPYGGFPFCLVRSTQSITGVEESIKSRIYDFSCSLFPFFFFPPPFVLFPFFCDHAGSPMIGGLICRIALVHQFFSSSFPLLFLPLFFL